MEGPAGRWAILNLLNQKGRQPGAPKDSQETAAPREFELTYVR
jgi:hypothetical protein